MKDTIFLLVKVKINTNYQSIHDAISELQTQTDYTIGSTENVQVIETQIMDLKTKN